MRRRSGKARSAKVIVTRNEPMTDRGLLLSTPCRGEKYHETTIGTNGDWPETTGMSVNT